MKVLYFINDSNLYGSNKSLLEIIRTIKNKEYIPILIIPRKGPIESELKKYNIEYYIVKYYNCIEEISKKTYIKSKIKIIWNKIIIKKLSKIVKIINPDLIVLNNSAVSIGAEIALKLNIKYYWHIREYLEEDHNLQFINKEKTLKLINGASAIVYVSKSVQNKYKDLIVKPPYIDVIYNGLDTSIYKDEKIKEISKNINIIISGSINGRKGHLDAINAMKELVKDNYTNYSLIIAGSGPMENNYKKYVKEQKLDKYIKFIGYKKNLYGIRHKANIALVCSINEAYGRVTAESMLAKNFVIGTNSGGTAELIKNGETGLLYEYQNSKELSQKIIEATKDYNTYAKIVNNAYNFANENLSIEQYAQKIYSIYIKILEKGK